MIEKAYIQEYGHGKMEPEHLDIKLTLESRNVPVTIFTQKRIDRNQLNLHANTLVVGETQVVGKALKYLNVPPPLPNTYPNALKFILKRRVWESTINKVLIDLHNEAFVDGIFVKPKDVAKKFTGCILKSDSDLYKLQGVSKNTNVYCSEVVHWLSEYRVFVTNGKIVGIKHYDGNPNVEINYTEASHAIDIFEQSSEKTCAYGIDFGILESGETALVEWNDGYSLGSYNLDSELYTDLILARWGELMNIFKT